MKITSQAVICVIARGSLRIFATEFTFQVMAEMFSEQQHVTARQYKVNTAKAHDI
jgi:hypothetical protein